MRAEATLVATPILPLSSCPRVEGREYVLMMSDNRPIICTWKQASYPTEPGKCGWWSRSAGLSINFTTRAEDSYFVGWIDPERLPKLSPDLRTGGLLLHKSGRVCVGGCYRDDEDREYCFTRYGLDDIDRPIPFADITAILDFRGTEAVADV